MTTPCLRAVSMISSSARPTTVLPLSLNSIGIVAACWVLSRSIANALLRELVRKVLHHAEQRVRRRLAEAADRGIRHRLGELVEQRLVPLALRHQRERLGGPDPARRALPTGFVPEKPH